MSTLHVICTAFNRPIQLRMMIDSFLLQTDGRWKLTVIHDGQASQEIHDIIGWYNDNRITFFETDIVGGSYGHPNRKYMLNQIQGDKDDFVLITNEDNYYVPAFVEYFLGACTPRVGMVYCNTIHSYLKYNILVTKVKENYIDMGSFIVRLAVAKATGFNHAHLSADGKYAEECFQTCRKRGLMPVCINKPLFVHN